ncbi:hypothetical protein BLNAU_10359 [Blattamonas nauphoetae]|uniref:Uncharacterized protein n=1 Tax=Blattamonas nauphoetae TaxID=2049346 RepID=A0ABQ9XT95_9EUKA|nr:hypothetical protein BLNAU_10359 [Blattamonas nauphoetae]
MDDTSLSYDDFMSMITEAEQLNKQVKDDIRDAEEVMEAGNAEIAALKELSQQFKPYFGGDEKHLSMHPPSGKSEEHRSEE